MTSAFQVVEGGVTRPTGFLASGVACGIQRAGPAESSRSGIKPDLGLIVSRTPAAVAGCFTTNQFKAAPVQVSLSRTARETAQGIVVNSGNANACTGAQGLRDARQMALWAARQVEIPEEAMLVCSTGRIGRRLPMERLRRGIQAAAKGLGGSRAHGRQFAKAIMTTDTRVKEIAVSCRLGARTIFLGGACKGAGMIHPGMSPTGDPRPQSPLHATMLAFLTSDVAIETGRLRSALSEAVASSFNRITVDGDRSTNDTVLLLANGLAANPPLRQSTGRAFKKFEAALHYVTGQLARMIVRDGEGATKCVTVAVHGARSPGEADAAARAMANSALVKASWYGGDPNWGRLLGALGNASARVQPDKVDLGYCLPSDRRLCYAVRRGTPASTKTATLRKIVREPEFEIHVHLHLGRYSAMLCAADLTEEYVDFNKDE